MLANFKLTPDRVVLSGLILTVVIYCRDLRYDFILDDIPLILLNETFMSWRNWPSLFTSHISSSSTAALLTPIVPAIHYRPLYMLWLMTISKLFGMSTPWLHLASLLLHVVVVYLVYVLTSKMLENSWVAALAALLFAFHPIHAESVVYISAVTDLLVAFFLLISLLSYLRLRERQEAILCLGFSVLCAALAILSKETAAMFPAILVAYEALSKRQAEPSPLWKRLLWTLPYFAVVILYVATRTALFGTTLGPDSAEHKLSAIGNLPLVAAVYLQNLVSPFHLSSFYPIEWTAHWSIARGAFLLVVVAAGLVLWRRDSGDSQRGVLRIQLAWTAIFLAPALAAVFIFVRDDWVHDRHTYLASVPFCVLVSSLLLRRGLPRWFSVAASTAIVATFLVTLWSQVPRFKDEVTLYESALQVAPHSMPLRGYYAMSLMNYGRTNDALAEFQKNTLLWPNSPLTHEGYADALVRAGQEDEGRVEFQEALRYETAANPFRAFLLYRLAGIELKQGRSADANVHMREATQIDPQRRNYHALLAAALRLQGLPDEAKVEDEREATLRARLMHEHPNPAARSILP